MSDESEREHARMADEASREAHEAAERAKAEAERAKTDALTGEGGEEVVRQQGLIYGGLIGIAVVMIQPFLAAASLDVSGKICVIAFAVAMPLLAALVMVNRQEAFRRRKTSSISVTVAQVIAQASAFVGIVAGFWHINWVAGRVLPRQRPRGCPGPFGRVLAARDEPATRVAEERGLLDTAAGTHFNACRPAGRLPGQVVGHARAAPPVLPR